MAECWHPWAAAHVHGWAFLPLWSSMDTQQTTPNESSLVAVCALCRKEPSPWSCSLTDSRNAELSIPQPAGLMEQCYPSLINTCTAGKRLPWDPWFIQPASSTTQCHKYFSCCPKTSGDWLCSTWAPRTDPTAACTGTSLQGRMRKKYLFIFRSKDGASFLELLPCLLKQHKIVSHFI